MSSRDMVMQHVNMLLKDAWKRGDLHDAWNLHSYLTSLEGMTDDEYESWVEEVEAVEDGAIS